MSSFFQCTWICQLPILDQPCWHSHFHRQPRPLENGRLRSHRFLVLQTTGNNVNLGLGLIQGQCHCNFFVSGLHQAVFSTSLDFQAASELSTLMRQQPLNTWLHKSTTHTSLLFKILSWWYHCFSYQVCVRMESGYCCVEYQPCSDPNSYTIDAKGAIDNAANTDSTCDTDWLAIAGTSRKRQILSIRITFEWFCLFRSDQWMQPARCNPSYTNLWRDFLSCPGCHNCPILHLR